jgi:hypothetical protein
MGGEERMRLIDADKLNIYDVSPAYGTCVMGVTEEDIELAPTVDAVPLEWIKRRIEGLNIQAENSTDDNKWAEFAREAFALEKIVKFWAERKEE